MKRWAPGSLLTNNVPDLNYRPLAQKYVLSASAPKSGKVELHFPTAREQGVYKGSRALRR